MANNRWISSLTCILVRTPPPSPYMQRALDLVRPRYLVTLLYYKFWNTEELDVARYKARRPGQRGGNMPTSCIASMQHMNIAKPLDLLLCIAALGRSKV